MTVPARGFDSPRLHSSALQELAELSRNSRIVPELRDRSEFAADCTFSPFPPVSCAFCCAFRCAQGVAKAPELIEKFLESQKQKEMENA